MNVLLFSKCEAVRETIEGLLARCGAQRIVAVDNVDDAVLHANDVACELVVLASVGSRDTLKLIRGIRRQRIDLPILFVADGLDRELIIAAIRAGCSDYLAAPLSAETLEAKLEKWTGAAV